MDAERKRLFFRVRVAVLLTVFVGVLLYAWHDVRSRRERTTWDHRLDVGIVVLADASVDDAAVTKLRERSGALAERMRDEMKRWRGDGGIIAPFAFHVTGPVRGAPPPPAPRGDGAIDLARSSFELGAWARTVNGLAGVDAAALDVVVYVVARRPASEERSFVEGRSEEGGRLAVVEVELDPSMADLALIVASHELMHTLGASDKYDAAGRALFPDGFAEPERQPLYPQRFAEVMARNRPVSPQAERIPVSLDELAVGRATAREIGWIP